MGRRWVLVAIVATGCSGDITATTDAPPGGPHVDAPGGVGEPANLMGMTLDHNNVRAMTGASPALPALEWDPALAALATAWASQCVDTDGNGLVDHSSNASRTNAAGYAYVGENIFAGSGPASADEAVGLWAAEGAHWHNDTASCDSGAVCGHYTQIVWRTTLKVGCALVNCPGLMYPNTILCNYGPGGNDGGPAY